jgi:sugar phosphate isomerase/epimerase
MHGHSDIRIGTLAKLEKGAGYLRQILPHGFESFSLTCWQYLKDIDLQRTAREVREVCGDKAVISSVGIYGNPLTDAESARDFARLIDAAPLFGAPLVCGFAGAVEGQPLPESIPQFKKVFGDLLRRATDLGLRIALENCEMHGTWESPKWNIANCPAAWELIFDALPNDHLGLEWEPCHQMTALIDPLPQLRQWVGKVFHVHGKDATIDWNAIKTRGTRGGQRYVWHRTPGFGDTNWTDLISILRQHHFKGSIDIEGWHDPVYRDALEMTGQVHALNYLRSCRGGAFIPNPT